MLGNRQNLALPGRLFRHGEHFDFMTTFRGHEPSKNELNRFVELVNSEIVASRTTEKMIYDSRKKDRDRFTLLQRKLIVE
jgi:hypothetical protein